MDHEKGFILLLTLIMIAIITLLLLTSMQHVLLYYKALNKQEAQHQAFYQLETMAMHLARNQVAPGSNNCVLHEDSANQIMQHLIANQGCSLADGSSQYKYFIEDLGAFPCMVVEQENQKRATYHRRISIASIEEGQPVSLLQVRAIRLGSLMPCHGEEHVVTLGISSWRYLPAISSS